MLIIPAIDLKHGQCVRLTQGRKEQVKVYDDDAVEVALKFEAEGARYLHVVDLDGRLPRAIRLTGWSRGESCVLSKFPCNSEAGCALSQMCGR